MLKVFERDGSPIEYVKDYEFNDRTENGVNTLVIFGNKRSRRGKIVEINYDMNFIDKGILVDNTFDAKLGKTSFDVYPLIFDLIHFWFEDSTGSKEVTVNDTIENVLGMIFDIYNSKTNTPILKWWPGINTGIVINKKYEYKNLLEVYRDLEKLLIENGYFLREIDGNIEIMNSPEVILMRYPEDVPTFMVKEEHTEIVNYVVVKRENGVVEVKDQGSIDEYGAFLKYEEKTDIKDEATAIGYAQGLINAGKEPKLSIDQVEIRKNIPLFSKIQVVNFDINELWVYGKKITRQGRIYVDMGLFDKRKQIAELVGFAF